MNASAATTGITPGELSHENSIKTAVIDVAEAPLIASQLGEAMGTSDNLTPEERRTVKLQSDGRNDDKALRAELMIRSSEVHADAIQECTAAFKEKELFGAGIDYYQWQRHNLPCNPDPELPPSKRFRQGSQIQVSESSQRILPMGNYEGLTNV